MSYPPGDPRGTYAYRQRRKAELKMAIGRPCPVCGMPMRYNDVLEWDHIVPVALGGSHDPANMRVVHKACNRKAGGSLGGHRKAAKWQLMEAELRRLRGY